MSGSAPSSGTDIRIFVDADACPVKEETYRVAFRYGLKVFVVSNAMMAIPQSPLVERVIVEQGPDVADDWIAERASAHDIVVTADIPLAARCVAAGSQVLNHKGARFDESSIGMTLAVRNLMDDLRSNGTVTTHTAPFSKSDRSGYLSALDTAVVRLQKTMRMVVPRTVSFGP